MRILQNARLGQGLSMLLVAMAFTAGGCAARKPMYSTDVPVTATQPDVHARIDELQATIAVQQAAAGWDKEPSTAPLFPMDAALPMAEQAGQRACPGSRNQATRCTKMCELAGSICHNADEICKLADEVGANLGRDDWAKQKCGNAAIACQQGQMRCCACDGSKGAELTP
jgi:hypothetical protein